MSFKQFIFLNTVRNKKLYVAYFMSIVFSVMVYFTFSVFSAHPFLIENIGHQVSKGMGVAQAIIYGFAFFFVLYSMGVFLQSRKREFGTLLIQGMSPRQLRSMIFFENFLIGVLATIVGIVFGLGFASVMLYASRYVLEFVIPWYFPLGAMAGTFVAFLLLFFVMSVMIQFRLPQLSIQELLKSAENGMGEIRTSAVKMVLAIVFLTVGYGLALVATGSVVFVVFIPVVVLVIAGTYFFFHQLCVRVAHQLTKRTAIFWKRTNMIVFSDLAFRMKENARAFFLVSIISTVAFVSIGTLQGFQTLTYRSLDAQVGEISYLKESGDDDTIDQAVTQALENASIPYTKVSIPEKDVPQPDGRTIRIVPVSAYNNALTTDGESPITVGEQDIVQARIQNSPGTVVTPTVTMNGNEQAVSTITVQKSPLYEGVLIAGDMLFQQLTGEAVTEATNEFWIVPSSVSTTTIARAVDPLLSQEDYLGVINSKSYMKKQMADIINPTLFVGLFIGIVFFVSAGSFLYFRLYSDFDMDVAKFKMVHKIGLTNRELNRMITQQVAVLFFVPIIVSLCHGVVALNALFRMFDQSISAESLFLLGAFAIIQIVFFVVAKMVYTRKIHQALAH